MEWVAILGAFIIAGFGIAKVFGDASRLGRGEERSHPRDKTPLDFDTDFL